MKSRNIKQRGSGAKDLAADALVFIGHIAAHRFERNHRHRIGERRLQATQILSQQSVGDEKSARRA